jgi:hypothetical protein
MVCRGGFGGLAGGALIGALVLLPWGLLAALVGLIPGAVIGLVVGLESGFFLLLVEDRVVDHDWCARRLAFTTSAAPFLLLAVLTWPEIAWPLLFAAGVSGVAGAVLAPWVVNGRAPQSRLLR